MDLPQNLLHVRKETRVGAMYWVHGRLLLVKMVLCLKGEKKEGDNKTPAGLYALGEAFGSIPMALKMDYKYIPLKINLSMTQAIKNITLGEC